MVKVNEEFKNLIPELSENEYHDLEDSVIMNGMYETVKTWNDYIIDGHNRYNIAVINGCEHILRFEALNFDNETEVKIWIVNNQLGRRNINDYVRVTLSLLKKDWLSEIAKEKENARKSDHSTLPKSAKSNVREKLAKEAGVSGDTFWKVETINNDPNITPETKRKLEVGAKGYSINSVFKDIKKAEKEEKRLILNNEYKDKKIDIQLINGDMRTVELPNVDLIITDPPYPEEYLSLFSDLSRRAYEVLKPSGFLLCYSGELHLLEVMNRLSEHLTYYWTIALNHNGNHQQVHARSVFCGWKPILVFQKPPFKKHTNYFYDCVTSSKKEKDGHEWQQGQDAVADLIERFSNPGDKILDLFAGSGTTLIAAKKLKRIPIGVEIEEKNIGIIKQRLEEK